MKKIVIISFVLTIFGCKSIQKITGKNMSDQETILAGQKTKTDLEQLPYASWFTPGFENYNPRLETIAALSKHTDDITIKIVMGTWCEDSHNQVPHFYKILKQINFDLNKATLIAVGKNKTTPDHLEEGLNITHVPTFIIYKNGKEINRIVEVPIETLEKDLLKILSGQSYKHTYEK